MRPDHERLNRAPAENLDEAIDDALEGSVRAQQLREYISALSGRQKIIARDFELTSDQAEKAVLQTKLDEIDEQLSVLREEEGINRFIEDTVKFSHEVHRLSEG
ncbi:MAG TPA: hypothetical protein VGB45_03980 [Abditibacterium sp.]|jgi:hypothetical protein